MTTGRPSSRQLSQHSSPLSTTAHSPRNPPLGVFGVPSALGNQASPILQGLATAIVNGQSPLGIMVAPRGRGQQALPIAGRFMPALTDPPPPQPAQPNPQMSALHQAHLRDPMLVQSPGISDKSSTRYFYQMVSYYLLPPKRLASGARVQEWKFDLHEGEYNHIARTMRSNIEGQRSTRVLAEGSHQYRLRCSKMPQSVSQLRSLCVVLASQNCR